MPVRLTRLGMLVLGKVSNGSDVGGRSEGFIMQADVQIYREPDENQVEVFEEQ